MNAAFDEISTDEKVESADGRCFLIDKGIAYNADQWFKARSKKLGYFKNHFMSHEVIFKIT